MRPLYFAAGCLMAALGIIGAFVPLMPTTIFLIIAAWCFARSSPRLEAWLFGHKRFGPVLRNWRDHGAMSRRAKIAACSGMAFGFALFLGLHPTEWLLAVVGLVLLACMVFVVTRPELRS